MRSLLIISHVAAIIGSALPPSHMHMVMFVSCECLEPERETRDLYEMFKSERDVLALYRWFKLDEATFLEMARRPAKVAHDAVLLKSVGTDLGVYMGSLRTRGLSEDQILTELLKKYYKSLKSKTALIQIDEEEDEFED